MELLKRHPVADDVLDVVSHHRQHVGDEVSAIAGMPQGGEGLLDGRGRLIAGLGQQELSSGSGGDLTGTSESF
jgi:hypothetical protein